MDSIQVSESHSMLLLLCTTANDRDKVEMQILDCNVCLSASNSIISFILSVFVSVFFLNFFLPVLSVCLFFFPPSSCLSLSLSRLWQ